MAKGFGGGGMQMNGLVKQAQAMQQKITKMQEDLASYEITGTSGGGMVTVVINGKQEVKSIKINKEVVNPDDVEMLEDLILSAFKAAFTKSSEYSQKELSKVTGGLSIPGLF